MSDELVASAERLRSRLSALVFAAPVTHVLDPTGYARAPYHQYLRRFGAAQGRVLLLGMNPGPFGMTQTGVPFGEVRAVRDFLGVAGVVEQPAHAHPKRPIEGFGCRRAEVSGARLWGWAEARYGTATRFFERFFVMNYCPLVFLEASGRNRTPDKLPRGEQHELFAACDEALREACASLAPALVVGVGAFAAGRARSAVGGELPVATVLHPSPANPRANRGWAEAAEAELRAAGVDLG